MIITRTPVRISFCGGGSDIGMYYRKYGGAVVSVTINKYIFLSLHPFFYGDKYFLKYSKSELVNNLEQIKHPIIRQVFSDYNIDCVDFNSSADIPAGTGLGSSSAFSVGLINLCNAYVGRYMNKDDVAKYACEIEIEKLKEPIGKQDQYACALGGLNFIQFNQDDTVSSEKIFLDSEKRNCLEKNLMLFYTNISRSASEILHEVTQFNHMKEDCLHQMVGLAKNLRSELLRGNIDILGEYLHESWLLKKNLSKKISSDEIDHYYQLALENGATGGKLLGAGGGGFLLFYVQPENQPKLRDALKNLKEVNFNFDYQGTNIIYYD